MFSRTARRRRASATALTRSASILRPLTSRFPTSSAAALPKGTLQQAELAAAGVIIIDPDPDPRSDQRTPALAWRTHPELPGRLPHCRGEVRSRRRLFQLDA